MAIIPGNNDPLKDYVTPTSSPPLTEDGLVFNKNYAYTGVIDTLINTTTSRIADPVLNQVTPTVLSLDTTVSQQNTWISSQQYGPNGTVSLTYTFNNPVYYNNLTFYVLNVPCTITITNSAGQQLGDVRTVVGNNTITTNNWVQIQYLPSYTLYETTSITITFNFTGITDAMGNNLPYSVGMKNLRVMYDIQSTFDLTVASGTISGGQTTFSGLTTQNRFHFVENYSIQKYPVTNVYISSSGTNFWKCSPQPVKDAVVYFYSQLGTVSGSNITPNTINRLYIDPLYSNNRMNVYFTTVSSTTNLNLDNATWTPIQRDFTLRKGIYELPMVSATHLKFEFTKLTPEVYDLPYDTVMRTVNVFPQDVEQYYSNLEQNLLNGNSATYSAATDKAYQAAQNNIPGLQGKSTVFGLGNQQLTSSNNWPLMSSLNTFALGNVGAGYNNNSYLVDPTTSYKILNADGTYNQLSLNEFLTRKFYQTGQHKYLQLQIEQSWHQAYFTGIKYVTAFYANRYDEFRGFPGNLTAYDGSTTNFTQKANNYIVLSPGEVATTPWYSSLESFSSFNFGAQCTDWQPFYPSDDYVLFRQGSTYGAGANFNSNSSISLVPNLTLGSGNIVQVSGLAASGTVYGIKSTSYLAGNNLLSYNDANFLSASGNWTPSGTTTITGATVTLYTGANTSGIQTVSGIKVNTGGNYTVKYNFTIPNITNASGVQPWSLALGTAPLGTVGYVNYTPASGVNYYFLVGAQASGVSGTTPTGYNFTFYTQFIDPSTGTPIAGTTVTGSTVTITGVTSLSQVTLTGTNYTTSGAPSNTIQLVVSGTPSGSAIPYYLFQAGAFNSPTSTWVSPSIRNNMRVSGLARLYLPTSNKGTYRIGLWATNTATNTTAELVYKQYSANSLPLNTWTDVELQTYITNNYTNFYVQVVQIDTTINETFYASIVSPFYYPVRFEYNTTSGTPSWQPITTGLNDPNTFINTGVTCSGVQIRATALDPNVYLSLMSTIPYYTQNPYYSDLDFEYVGNSKTNQITSREAISNRSVFMLNSEPHPSRFFLAQITNNVIGYSAT